ncbi:uncharacterized protein LOC110850374 [Folsomia candida]|nr:uncharacterized protein LOC110850374 [Folsomia candida]XP_035708045.1 uncharacterized protein LOC110850374 [Folsomia candida]XP_035708046.1 uncharacterized protein LOC110850374 [Folsomia candida]
MATVGNSEVEFKEVEVLEIMLGDEKLFEEKREFSLAIGIKKADVILKLHRLTNNQITMKNYYTEDLEKLRSGSESPSEMYAKLIKILENLKLLCSAKKVEKLSGRSEVEKEKSQIFHGVPPQDAGLVGRDAEHAELDNFRTKKPYKVVYISGLPGQGKTQFIIQYVTSIRDDFNICWLSAHNVTTLTHSLTKFASDELPLKTDTLDKLDKMTFPELMSTVLSGMNKLGQQWITVLDNVDTKFDEFVELVKNRANATDSFTLVTSRINNLLNMTPNIGHMILGGLKLEDAKTLITNQIDGATAEEANKLWEIVGGHPFSLQQCSSSIRQEKINYQCSVSDFLNELEHDISLGMSCKAFEYEMEIQEPTAIILGKTLAKLDPAALECLYVLSYMHSKNVPLDLASYIFHVVFNTEKAHHEISLRKLKEYNLVSVEDNTTRTHGLVQWAAKRALNSSDNVAKKSEIEQKLLNSIGSKEIGKVLNTQNAFHLVTIYDQIQLSTGSVVKVVCPDVNIVQSIFEKLRDVSALREAFDFINKALLKFRTALGADNKHTLQVEGLLYQAMIKLGRYDDAVAGLKSLYSKLIASQGLNHELTLYVGNDLARALHFSGHVDQAMVEGEKVFLARKELLGERHVDTLISWHNLAICMSDWKRGKKQFEEAGAIHEEIFKIRLMDLGENHQSTLNSRHQVAYCKLQHALQRVRKSEEEEELWVGEITEVKKELEKISEIRGSVLGEDNTETLRTQYWLCVAMINLNDSEERDKAVVILNKVLEKRIEVLREEHVEAIDTKKLVDKIEGEKRDGIDFGFEIYS